MKTCSCGAPGTHQTPAGTVNRGGVWRRAWTWCCEACHDEAVRGREEARAS